MRIAIDTRELHGQPTGVGRYLAELLSAWERLPAARAHEFIRLVPDESHGGTLWEQFALPRLVREAGAQVLFAPAYTAPLRCPVPFVVTIHDVSYYAHPEWFGWVQGARRRIITRLAARRAARILTVSAFSRQEILRHLGVEASQVEAIHSGVSPVGPALRADQAIPKGSPHTLLYVGSLFNRRQIPELIEGFSRLAARRPDVRLELVGDNRSRPRIDVNALVAASSQRDAIGIRTYAPDDELTLMYRQASAFVFLSTYEGFGFSPLEALSAGLPIVVLDTPVSREIYGDAAIYVATPDPRQIESALERALFDADERARVLAAAPAVLARYSWDRCAAQVLDALLAAGRQG